LRERRVAVGFGVGETGTEVRVGGDIDPVGRISEVDELAQEDIVMDPIIAIKERRIIRITFLCTGEAAGRFIPVASFVGLVSGTDFI
jgi:hypothetical protein